jgi:hypothetical protein
VLRVSRVFRAQLDRLVLKDHKVLKVLKVTQDQLVHKVRLV